MKLDTQRLQTLDQVREFLAGSRPLDLQPQTRAEAYAFVAEAPATVRLLPPGEGRQGPDPPLPEQGDRPLTRAGHPPAAPAPDHRSHRRPPPPPAPLPTPLHQGRHRAARRSRCPPRHPLRSGHPQALRPGLAAVRRPQLRAPRRHLQRTPLQPAPLDQLSTPPRDDARADPPRAHRHRRAAPAPALRTTRLPAGRFRPPRRPPRHQGPLPPQPRRRGHPVPASSSKPCSGRSPSTSADSTPTTVRSSSTTKSPPGCKPSTSTSSPSPDPAAATTTPSSRARTARSSASTSDTATSPAVTLNASTPSPSRSSPPT